MASESLGGLLQELRRRRTRSDRADPRGFLVEWGLLPGALALLQEVSPALLWAHCWGPRWRAHRLCCFSSSCCTSNLLPGLLPRALALLQEVRPALLLAHCWGPGWGPHRPCCFSWRHARVAAQAICSQACSPGALALLQEVRPALLWEHSGSSRRGSHRRFQAVHCLLHQQVLYRRHRGKRRQSSTGHASETAANFAGQGLKDICVRLLQGQICQGVQLHGAWPGFCVLAGSALALAMLQQCCISVSWLLHRASRTSQCRS